MDNNEYEKLKHEPNNSFNDYKNYSNNRRGFLFMPAVLNKLSSGDFFKRIFSIVLKVLAVLFAITGIVLWVKIWGTIADLSIAGIIGGLIFQIIFLVTIYMFVHTLWLRANEIRDLSYSGYAVIPIASTFFKLWGELYACILVPLSIAGGILMWFTGSSYRIQFLLNFLPLPRFLTYNFTGSAFLDGLIFMIAGFIVAFFVLLFFYLISEIIRIGVDIAHNTAATREAVEVQRAQAESPQDTSEENDNNSSSPNRDENLFN